MNDSIPSLGQFMEPLPVTFTLGAPGWYVLTVLLVLCVSVLIVWRWVHFRKNRYRREALKRIDAEQQKLLPEAEYGNFIYFVNMLMKQINMLHYGRKKVASLQGKQWIDHLNSCCKKPIFNTQDETLLTALYLSGNIEQQTQIEAFADKARQWIKNHRYVTRNRS